VHNGEVYLFIGFTVFVCIIYIKYTACELYFVTLEQEYKEPW